MCNTLMVIGTERDRRSESGEDGERAKMFGLGIIEVPVISRGRSLPIICVSVLGEVER